MTRSALIHARTRKNSPAGSGERQRGWGKKKTEQQRDEAQWLTGINLVQFCSVLLSALPVKNGWCVRPAREAAVEANAWRGKQTRGATELWSLEKTNKGTMDNKEAKVSWSRPVQGLFRWRKPSREPRQLTEAFRSSSFLWRKEEKLCQGGKRKQEFSSSPVPVDVFNSTKIEKQIAWKNVNRNT